MGLYIKNKLLITPELLILLCLICCLMTTEAQPAIGSGVLLDSTLKQSSLCPGDGSTTFSCTASGTELVWIVGEGRSLSFSYRAPEGASRRDEDGRTSATLMNIDNAEDNGYAVRFSVLRVSAQPLATEVLSVKCHNGSQHLAEEIQYLPRSADPPVMPEIEATLDDKSRVANISWTAPINNADLNYYAISVDDDNPLLTKNTSILYNLSSSDSKRFLSLRAVDRCGQEGRTANITIPGVTLVTTSENDLVPTVIYNGVEKGRLSWITLLLYIASSTLIQ